MRDLDCVSTISHAFIVANKSHELEKNVPHSTLSLGVFVAKNRALFIEKLNMSVSVFYKPHAIVKIEETKLNMIVA